MLRARITLSVAKNSALPINYQYELSSWIYKVISHSNEEVADWLHNKGYETGTTKKAYKLFTFNNLDLRPYRIDKEKSVIICLGNTITLDVSFYGDEILQHFITGLFMHQQFTLGTKHVESVKLIVSNVAILPKIDFSNHHIFQAKSPICLSEAREDAPAQYLSPSDDGYEDKVAAHLTRKFLSIQSHFPNNFGNIAINEPIKWKNRTDNPRSKLITIKAHTKQATKVRGYLYQFEMTAPRQIIEMLYYGGFGEKTSIGFGFLELIK